jgi:hypothetical protein
MKLHGPSPKSSVARPPRCGSSFRALGLVTILAHSDLVSDTHGRNLFKQRNAVSA